MKKFARYQLPIILYAGLIFLVSSISRLPRVDIGIGFVDKLAHFSEYFIFFILAFRAIYNLPSRVSRGFAYTVTILISMAFAASDEFHQSFVPGRDADILDFLTDSLAVLTAAAVHILQKRGFFSRMFRKGTQG